MVCFKLRQVRSCDGYAASSWSRTFNAMVSLPNNGRTERFSFWWGKRGGMRQGRWRVQLAHNFHSSAHIPELYIFSKNVPSSLGSPAAKLCIKQVPLMQVAENLRQPSSLATARHPPRWEGSRLRLQHPTQTERESESWAHGSDIEQLEDRTLRSKYLQTTSETLGTSALTSFSPRSIFSRLASLGRYHGCALRCIGGLMQSCGHSPPPHFFLYPSFLFSRSPFVFQVWRRIAKKIAAFASIRPFTDYSF